MGKNLWPWTMAFMIVAAGVFFGLVKSDSSNDPKTTRFTVATPDDHGAGDKPKLVTQAIVPLNSPVVTAFTGDVADGGNKENDGTLIPFVIGDSIKLSAEATNAVEYCWKVNGKTILEKGQEWSVRKDRDYDIASAEELHISVQVRGADQRQVSLPKEATVKPVAVFIRSFDAFLAENPDRALTGDEYTVQVDLAEPIGADFEFYKLRYSINDVPIKHPEDGLEWTTERDLTYTFPAPGRYTFKVEVRRATEKEPEESKVMAETITVGDAIVLSFDATPEKSSPVGTAVDLGVFNMSLLGKSDCRFGVKKIIAAGFNWLPDENNLIWGSPDRTWLPTEPGNYLIRAEVREVGKEQADDFREIFYTVTEGDF